MRFMMVMTAVLALLAPALATPAAAQETAESNRNNQNYTLDIPHCDFLMTLPGEPRNSYRCDPEDPELCTRVISFTKVFGIDATMNFNITCNPATEDMYTRYSGEVMQATLDAMVGRGALKEYQTDFTEGTDFKHAIIIGEGNDNNQDKIYSAQLWIGKSSVFTVEAEMIGFAGDENDALFADAVGSVRPRNPENAEAQTAAEDAPEAQGEAQGETPAEVPAETQADGE